MGLGTVATLTRRLRRPSFNSVLVSLAKHTQHEPVPALARGLAVWRLLAQEGPLPLEPVRERLGLPKASCYRLLETLCRLGYARRDSTRAYRLLWELRPLADPGLALRGRVEALLPGLAQRLQATVEWWEPRAAGLVLELQSGSDSGEVQVKARPGFLRRWGEELDAVARLGYALAAEAPPLASTLQHHRRNGVKEHCPQAAAQRLVATARARGWASDPRFNANGVRRHAVAVRRSDALAGILAAAELHRFGPTRPPPPPLAHLLEAAREVSD
jgi:DNA-binding IclR family transcriptional regulator